MYMLVPLSEHYDDGFGAVEDAFCNAAKGLRHRWRNRVVASLQRSTDIIPIVRQDQVG
jgi:hypothetical protein